MFDFEAHVSVPDSNQNTPMQHTTQKSNSGIQHFLNSTHPKQPARTQSWHQAPPLQHPKRQPNTATGDIVTCCNKLCFPHVSSTAARWEDQAFRASSVKCVHIAHNPCPMLGTRDGHVPGSKEHNRHIALETGPQKEISCPT